MSDEVKVIQVIRTRILRRGRGDREDDPIRSIEQYWAMDGTLLWEFDSWLASKAEGKQ